MGPGNRPQLDVWGLKVGGVGLAWVLYSSGCVHSAWELDTVGCVGPENLVCEFGLGIGHGCLCRCGAGKPERHDCVLGIITMF